MNVKFTVDYDLIELVDAIGLDYDIVDAKSDVIKNYKEIVIELDNIEELIDDVDDYNRFNDEELCECLIYTQRIYD